MKQLVLDLGLATAPTLANFLPGANQAALHCLCVAVGAQVDGRSHAASAPLPTYLWGDAGSGKTHLLAAVRQALHEQGQRVGWLAPALAAPAEFDPQWAALLLDDVHLYGPVQQAAAFNWFVNAASPASGAPRWVLAAGRRPVAELALREDLRSRLAWGHVFGLEPLTEAGRRSVLRREADARGLPLGEELLDYMLRRFARDLGSLMQLLDRLDAFALRSRRALSVALLRTMLESE